METNPAVIVPETVAERNGNSGKLFHFFLLVLSVLWLASVTTDMLSVHGRIASPWKAVAPLAIIFLAVMGLFGKGLDRIIQWTMGEVEYVQVCSAGTEQRLRTRYEPEIAQLRAAGFDPLFSCGEGFSLLRAFLIFPAILIILTLIKREMTTIENGAKYLLIYPVFGARDRSAFAFPFGLGVKFYTGFEDGTVLVSKNFESHAPSRPGLMTHAGKASISDAWAEHQSRIRKLELEGKRVEHQTSFEYFAKIVKCG